MLWHSSRKVERLQDLQNAFAVVKNVSQVDHSTVIGDFFDEQAWSDQVLVLGKFVALKFCPFLVDQQKAGLIRPVPFVIDVVGQCIRWRPRENL